MEAPIEKGSDLDKVWKAGEWIGENHPALRDANSYIAFMASQRGYRPTITVKNK